MLGLTNATCCHARENSDRYEIARNEWNYVNQCLTRYNSIRCRWDFDDIQNNCSNLHSIYAPNVNVLESIDTCNCVSTSTINCVNQFCSQFDNDILACNTYARICQCT